MHPLLARAWLACALTLPLAVTARAETLLVLQSARQRLVVADEPGLHRAASGTPVPVWRLTPGDAVRHPRTPRSVRLYQKIPGGLKLMAVIKVRYFAQAGRWVPEYRISEQMYFVPTPGGWKPLAFANGVPSLLSYTSPTLPNAQGYYHALAFSLTSALMAVDAWEVVPVTHGASPGAP